MIQRESVKAPRTKKKNAPCVIGKAKYLRGAEFEKRRLYLREPDLNNDKDEDPNVLQYNSLYHACENGESLQTVEKLLKQGKEVTNSTLDSVCRQGNLPLLELLAKYQPDILSHVYDGGESPILIAARYGYVEMVRYLFSQGVEQPADNPDTPFLEAVSHGNVDIAQLCFQRGDPGLINKPYTYKGEITPPLHLAVKNRDRKMVQWLLAQGADPNNINDQWEVALVIAGKAPTIDLEIIAELFENGAKVCREFSRSCMKRVTEAAVSDLAKWSSLTCCLLNACLSLTNPNCMCRR